MRQGRSRRYLKALFLETSARGAPRRRLFIDGPFAETGELIAGFWLWQVKDMAEAVAWAKRCPNPMPGPSEIEIRPVGEMADFGEALTPEVAELHEHVRDKARRGGEAVTKGRWLTAISSAVAARL